MTWDRPAKNITRILASPSRKVSKTLWMPSREGLDFDMAMTEGKIDTQGDHFFVERVPEYADEIDTKLTKYNLLHPIVHRGELHTLQLPVDLEYAHFDFLGGLTEKTAYWLHDNLRIANGGEMNFTFQYSATRGNIFVPECHCLIGADDALQSMLHEERWMLNRKDLNVSMCGVVLRCLLRQYDFWASAAPVLYCDNHFKMVLYKFGGFRRCNEPTAPDLLGKLIQRRREKGWMNDVWSWYQKGDNMVGDVKKIAEQIVSAQTVDEKLAATIAANAYVKERVRQGFSEERVYAAIKSQVKILGDATAALPPADERVKELADKFFVVQSIRDEETHYHSMRGLQRSITCYDQKNPGGRDRVRTEVARRKGNASLLD